MPHTIHTDLPPLSSQEQALFAAFVANGFNPEELLKNPSFQTSEVLAFLVSPTTQAHLAALNTTTHLALTIKASRCRRIALDALERVVSKTSTNTPEHHRAASTLIRATSARLIPSGESSSRTRSRPGSEPRPTQEPPPEPSAPPSDPVNLDDPQLIAVLQPQPGDAPQTLRDIARIRASIPKICSSLGRPIPGWFAELPPLAASNST